MEKFAVGSIVLVLFPFSNLKGKKVRPALVLAHAEFDDLILCQITSKPYASKIAVLVDLTDCAKGGLPIKSYVRLDKIFTADPTIIKMKVGMLTQSKKKEVLKKVMELFVE